MFYTILESRAQIQIRGDTLRQFEGNYAVIRGNSGVIKCDFLGL
jgi:hypothetical protein